jgi:hypothetical protein
LVPVGPAAFGDGTPLSLAGKFTDGLPDRQRAHPGAHVYVGTVSGHAPSDAIIIPDAHLLFGSDFKRSGVDLILSGDDREVVLHDYFKGEKRAALASPDGAHLTGALVNALAGHTQFVQADGSASVAPPVIGHVTKLAGTATAIRNGVSIILNHGDNVNKGGVVASGSDSTLGITFIDGTVFGLASAIATIGGATTEHVLTTGRAALDSAAGTVSYADINPGDVPTVKTEFASFTYQNSGHTDVTATSRFSVTAARTPSYSSPGLAARRSLTSMPITIRSRSARICSRPLRTSSCTPVRSIPIWIGSLRMQLPRPSR